MMHAHTQGKGGDKICLGALRFRHLPRYLHSVPASKAFFYISWLQNNGCTLSSGQCNVQFKLLRRCIKTLASVCTTLSESGKMRRLNVLKVAEVPGHGKSTGSYHLLTETNLPGFILNISMDVSLPGSLLLIFFLACPIFMSSSFFLGP